jgi:hypothetical protein
MKLNFLMLFLLIIPSLAGIAYGHTVDSVGEYRVEIGWMNEPVVSGETNAIEFYVSPLEPGLELEDQVFQNGVLDLKKTVKIKLIYKDQSITLPLSPDHNLHFLYLLIITFRESITLLSIQLFLDSIKQIFWEQLKTLQLAYQCIHQKLLNVLTLNFLNHLILQ